MEVSFEFFVPCGETAEVFETGETAFDAISFAIEFLVELALPFTVGLGGDDADRSHRSNVV